MLLAATAAAQDPFDKPMMGAAGPAKPAPAADPLEIVTGQGIILRAIRESNPTTALELLRAIEGTLDLEAYAECKRYLALLLQKKLTADELAKAHAKTGTALLMRIDHPPELQPEGKQVADLVINAAHAASIDPKRIDALVTQLYSPAPEKRDQARNDLAAVGVDAAGPMLKVLGQDVFDKEHDSVQYALITMHENLRGPTIAALESSKVTLRKNVMEVLGDVGSNEGMYRMLGVSLEMSKEGEVARDAIFRITGAHPTQADVEKLLDRRIKHLLGGWWPEARELGGLVIVWEWDDAAGIPKRRLMKPEDAALRTAAILARDLAKVAPDNAQYSRTALIARLEWEQRAVGWDKPLPTAVLQDLQKVPVPTLLDMLKVAVKENHTGAVLAAMQILAVTGDESLLHDGQYESLVASLISHVDRRIRLATIRAVVGWKPKKSFPGASRVADGLAYFLSGTGARKVLVGDVREDDAQTLVGLLTSVGYEADAFLVPRDMFKAATTQADYEFVLLSDAIDHPPVQELIQWMRRDYRSEHLLVGVLGRADTYIKIEQRLRGEYRVEVMPRLHGDQVELLYDPNAEDLELAKKVAIEKYGVAERLPAKSTIGRMLQLFQRKLAPDFVPAQERLEQAYIAADLTAELMNDRSPLRDDLGRIERQLVENMFRAEMTVKLAPIAAEIASPRVQLALVDLSSQDTFPLPARQAAAKAFARAVEKRGTLLTVPQIERQYARYNASETSDADTQKVLAYLLDVIEARALRSQAKAR